MKINDKCKNPLLKGRNKMILNPYIFNKPIPSDYWVYYKFDGNCNDSGPNGYNLSESHEGTYTPASYETDRKGNPSSCIRFQNTITNYQIFSSIHIDKIFNVNGITISAWIKHSVNVPNYNFPIELSIYSTLICTRDAFSSPVNQAFVKCGQNVPRYLGVLNNNWNHHVMTATSSGVMNYYINNTLILNNISCLAASCNTLTIGSGTNHTNPFNGYIDSLVVYERVLTSDEITTLYNE